MVDAPLMDTLNCVMISHLTFNLMKAADPRKAVMMTKRTVQSKFYSQTTGTYLDFSSPHAAGLQDESHFLFAVDIGDITILPEKS